MIAPDRKGQVWAEGDRVFIVTTAPRDVTLWSQHSVCRLDGESETVEETVDEGDITWESLPYMRRLR